VLTILTLILAVIILIIMGFLYAVQKMRVTLFISIGSCFGMLENLTKIFIIIMSLDKPLFIAVVLVYTLNVILGLEALELFETYSSLGYEEWKEFTKTVKEKKYPKLFTIWKNLWFLGPHSVRLS